VTKFPDIRKRRAAMECTHEPGLLLLSGLVECAGSDTVTSGGVGGRGPTNAEAVEAALIAAAVVLQGLDELEYDRRRSISSLDTGAARPCDGGEEGNPTASATAALAPPKGEGVIGT
jgi:hypothetical protein